jgi:hypothetical protein
VVRPASGRIDIPGNLANPVESGQFFAGLS